MLSGFFATVEPPNHPVSESDWRLRLSNDATKNSSRLSRTSPKQTSCWWMNSTNFVVTLAC